MLHNNLISDVVLIPIRQGVVVNLEFTMDSFFSFFDHLDVNIKSKSGAAKLSRASILIFRWIFEKRIIGALAFLFANGNGKDEVSCVGKNDA